MNAPTTSDREARARDLYFANRSRDERRDWNELRPTEKDEYRRQAEREGFRDDMSDGSSDQTNAPAYVETSMRGTMDDIGKLTRLADGGYSLDETQIFDIVDLEGPASEEEVREAAQERLDELPLCVERTVIFEIVLGIGGPDRRLLIECDQSYDAPLEIRRVLYRYSWSGSAAVELTGKDRENAEAFARQVVPELIE